MEDRPTNPNNPIVVQRTCKELSGNITIRHYYWCPGCDSLHGIAIRPTVQDNGAGWTFTGTLEKPTYEPSQLTSWGVNNPKRCHTFIREGMIQFLDDCTHELRNKTVPLPPLPDWFVQESEERNYDETPKPFLEE